ncbi:DUF2393 family protein [Sulfuricurvum sp. PD_MW2]|uniref:DUF2393 family protein n=1 Tax=Sulfuricurvum sp. PD_MW2 TaxID=2027917 RepID=UPI0025D7B538|nr:DUF2393 family protein [Sulfuricurvum sp. PD_MW2]
MSPLTTWHYLLIVVLILLFVLAIAVSLRTKYKFSILATLTLIIVLIGTFSWKAINEKAYIVEVSNLDKERYYQSEQIMIKGTVRNVGPFPVAHVVATIRLSNAHGGVSGKESIFTQPSVFAEIYQDKNPDFKRQNIMEEHVIADSLDPGHSKPFTILMKYPPYFTNASYTVEAKAN